MALTQIPFGFRLFKPDQVISSTPEALNGVWGREYDEAEISEEKRLFTERRGEGTGPFSEPLRSENCFFLFPFALLSFSLLISEDFWIFLSFLSDRNVFMPSDKCAENTAIVGK